MGLRVELKPGERFIIGRSVITNGDRRIQFYLEGSDPILREKDILKPEDATSPAKRIYLAVQLIYLSGESPERYDILLELCRQLIEAAPSTAPFIERINALVLEGSPYKALKEVKGLIAYEEQLVGGLERSLAGAAKAG